MHDSSNIIPIKTKYSVLNELITIDSTIVGIAKHGNQSGGLHYMLFKYNIELYQCNVPIVFENKIILNLEIWQEFLQEYNEYIEAIQRGIAEASNIKCNEYGKGVGNIKITLIDFFANPRECSIMTSWCVGAVIIMKKFYS